MDMTTADLKATVDAFEKGLIEAAYARHRYNQRATAAADEEAALWR